MGSARKGRDSPSDCPQKKMKTQNENHSEGAHWQVCGRPSRIAVGGGKEREDVGCNRRACKGSKALRTPSHSKMRLHTHKFLHSVAFEAPPLPWLRRARHLPAPSRSLSAVMQAK